LASEADVGQQATLRVALTETLARHPHHMIIEVGDWTFSIALRPGY